MRKTAFPTCRSLFVWGMGILAIGIISSCGNIRELTYVQGKFDTANLSKIEIKEPIIQKGDLLSVIIYSDNPLATAFYNQSLISMGGGTTAPSPGGGNAASGMASQETGSGTTAGNTSSAPGYLVDDQGNIKFQGLKPLHVEGLTKQQLKDSLDFRLDERLGGPLKNPYYAIRFLNYKFTLLGEVVHPGVFSIPGEHINLFEGLGLAGDMTFYGRRDNVLIMRVSNGKREFQRLDMTKPEILSSPYFYLQQGDVVYVEANKRKVAASDQVAARNVTIGASIVSTIAIIYSIFKK